MPPVTRDQRVAELHRHPEPPPGLEVHKAGLRHEVQRGDSAWGIARDYSQAYHMNVSPDQLQRTNAAAFADGLHPGELLRIPGLQARFDAHIRAEGGPPVPDTVHVVKRGDTLSSIARRHSADAGGGLTWQKLHAANRAVIGPDPHRIMPGQKLVIPGTGRDGYEVPPKRSLSDIDGSVVLTRVGRVQAEAGGVRQIDVMRFHADGSHAEHHGSVGDAIRSARMALAGGESRSNPIAIVQASDGVWTVPVRGEEVSENLDDSDRTLSLAWRAGGAEVIGVVDQPWDRPVQVRRFDR
jgi:LysM repeat protein